MHFPSEFTKWHHILLEMADTGLTLPQMENRMKVVFKERAYQDVFDKIQLSSHYYKATNGGQLPKLLLSESIIWGRVPSFQTLISVLDSALKQ